MANIFQKIINFIFRIDSALADSHGGGLPIFQIDNPLATGGNLEDALNAVSNLLLAIGIPLAALMYLWAGFQFLISGGEEKRIKSAKQTLIWTTVGIAVLLAARGIVIVVQGLLTP